MDEKEQIRQEIGVSNVLNRSLGIKRWKGVIAAKKEELRALNENRRPI